MFPGPGLSIIAFAFLTLVSWQRWPDLIYDFGQEAYIPWMISEGQVLYKDINYFHGPLSSYLHALVFSVTGPGLLYLAIFNLALIALLAGVIHQVIRSVSSRSTAAISTLTFLVVFAFAFHTGWGGLNFVCPYLYVLTQGMLLGFLALKLFLKYMEHPKPSFLAGLGVLMGLVYLTKMEVILATGLSLGIGLAILFWQERPSSKILLMRFLLMILGFALPVLPTFLYFSLHMPFEKVVISLNPWLLALNPRFQDLVYYRQVSGLLEFDVNVQKMIVHICVLVVTLAALLGLNHLLARKNQNTVRNGLLGAALFLGVGYLMRNHVLWMELPRSFPVLLLFIAGLTLYKVVKKFRSGEAKQPLALLVLTVFALAFTIKVFWNLKLTHLGFALALPATLVILVIGLNRLEQYALAQSGSSHLYRLTAFALVFLTLGVILSNSYGHYRNKIFPVGKGVDRIYDFPPNAYQFGRPIMRAVISEYFIEYLPEELGPEETLATLPDNMMFNYMVRRRFPTRDTHYNPVVWIITGEKDVLERYQQANPSHFLFVDFDFIWFGYRFFGKDYGQSIFRWIKDHYTVVKQVGPEPFTGQGFGMQLLKRNDLLAKQVDPK